MPVVRALSPHELFEQWWNEKNYHKTIYTVGTDLTITLNRSASLGVYNQNIRDVATEVSKPLIIKVRLPDYRKENIPFDQADEERVKEVAKARAAEMY